MSRVVKLPGEMTDAERDFWAQVAESVARRGIAGKTAQWYVRRVQEFCFHLRSLNQKLRDLEPRDLDRYLERRGRRASLEAWQLQQEVSALQVLFEDVVESPWARAYPWREHIDACRELGRDHATVARDLSAEEHVDAMLKRSGEGGVDDAARREINRLCEVLRVQGKALRTERTYAEWVLRFARYGGGVLPENPDRVAGFLEHLALKERVAPATQAQALNALAFFYRHVRKRELGDLGGFNLERAVARQRIVQLIHSHRFTEKPRRTLRVRLRFFANR
jgi:hypothetical protein